MPSRLLKRKASVLVLGAGSIGSRHARNLHAAGADVSLADPSPGRAKAVRHARTVPFDLDHLGGYDGVVVASPTSAHLEQALAALDTGAKVLIEKPIHLSLAGTEALLPDSDRVMVGFNLRFHPPVQRLVDLARSGQAGRITSVRAWFGSYLPDWRPTVDYRESYSARSELGGGVLLDAIHELDLLVWMLGGHFQVLGAEVARLGDLEIDVEDTVKTLLRHESGALAEVSLDYLSRRYRRGLEVIGTDATLRLDWAREVIEVEREGEAEVEPAIDSLACSYERQSECFLAWLRDKAVPPVDAVEAVASLRLADQIRAAATRRSR